MYLIKYNYNSGDSNGTDYNIEDVLELKFKSLDVAKDNLRRIKEHYLLYQELEGCYVGYKARKYKEILEEMATKDWAVLKKNGEYEYKACLILKADGGKPFQIYAPWCGYFESLNEAWIEEGVLKDNDMRISFR